MTTRSFPDGEVRYFYKEGRPLSKGGVVIDWGASNFLLISRTVSPHQRSKVTMDESPLCVALFFPEGGPVELSTSGRRMRVHPHEYGLCTLDKPYTVESLPQPVATHRMVLFFSIPFLNDIWEEIIEGPRRVLPTFEAGTRPRGPYLNSLLRLMFRESTVRAAPWLSSEVVVHHLAHWLFHSHHHHGETDMGVLVLPPTDDTQVERALEHIRTHVTQRAVIASAAEAAGLHANTLTSRMRKAIGISPKEFLARYRMERARVLMRETTLPVTEVSAAIGFESLSHFVRTFLKATGVTPLRFRHRFKDLR